MFEEIKAATADYESQTGERLFVWKHASLAAFSTMKSGGDAAILAFPQSETALLFCIRLAISHAIPYHILGRGSNTLFLSGVHQRFFLATDRLRHLYKKDSCISAACGVGLLRFLGYLANNRFRGGEKLFGIPGSIGGAVYMNAGAYGSAISDFLLESRIYDAKQQKIRTVSREEHGFSYRKSVFQTKKELILLESRFRFPAGDTEAIRQDMRAVMEKRRASQPLELPSLGSIFRREGDIPVARLIDELGLRGLAHGGAAVSEKHAGFLVNRGNATPEDILFLIEDIQNRLDSAYGIRPIPEIEIVR